MSLLTIDITDQQYRSLQAMAELHGKTVGQYAIERLFHDEAAEEQAWGELKALLTQRVQNALAGKVSPRTFREIVNNALGSERRA